MAGESAILDNQTLAGFVVGMWRDLQDKRVKATESWGEVEAYLYATDTHSLTNSQNGHSHSTHIPVLMEIKQDLESIIMATLAPHDDWFEFSPSDRSEQTINKKLAVENYIKNIHRRNGFRTTLKTLIGDLATYGNCFNEVRFENNTTGRNVGYVGPKAYRISPYDIVFNPAAPSFDDTYKIVREIVSLGEFIKRAKAQGYNQEAVSQILNLSLIHI